MVDFGKNTPPQGDAIPKAFPKAKVVTCPPSKIRLAWGNFCYHKDVLAERKGLVKVLTQIADDIRDHRTSAWEADWEKRLRLVIGELKGEGEKT